jgi:nicotinamide mononucleotide transporter
MTNIHTLETIAVICCFINIYLIARANIFNYLFGIVTVLSYFIIFLKTKLYADMSLQIVFLVLQFYGWYQWKFGAKTIILASINKATTTSLLCMTIITAILFAIISTILFKFTDSTTVYLDALITSLSLVAQWMMSKRWLAHWVVWMLVDLVSIKTYLMKDLYFTSTLYSILFLLCIYGYYSWKKTTSASLGQTLSDAGSLT